MELRKKNNELISEKNLILCTLILFLITFIPLILLCFYIHPSDNDNWLSFQGWKSNSPLHQTATSFKLGLRYSSSIISIPFFTRLPSAITEEVMKSLIFRYRMLAFTEIILFTSCFYYFCFSFNKYVLKFKKQSFYLLFSIFYFLFINSCTYIFQTFYEMISASGYTFGLSMFILFMGLLVRYYHIRKGYLLLFITLFLSCGTVEFYPILCGSVLLYLLIYKFIKNKKVDIYMILLGLVTLTILVAYMINPGQQTKIEIYSQGDWVTNKSPYEIKSMIHFVAEYAYLVINSLDVWLSPKTLVFSILLSFVVSKSLYEKKINVSIFVPIYFYFVILLCGFTFHICYLNIMGLQRASTILSELLCFNNLLLLISFELILLKNEKVIVFVDKVFSEIKDILLNYTKVSLGVLIIYLGLICVWEPGLVLREINFNFLRGRLSTYNNEMNERYKTIINTDESIVEINPLSEPPRVVFYTDTAVDGDWAKFFNKNQIVYKK